MKKILTLLFIASTLIVQAQHKQTRQLQAHDGIAVSTGLAVVYVKSNQNEIVIECENDEHFDLISTKVKKGILEIHYKPKSSINTKKPNKVTVYSNYTLQSAKASANADLTISDPIQTDNFSLSASSSGDIVTNSIKANKINIQLSSSADVNSKINATTVNMEASSSADAILSGTAKNVTVNMSSSADVDLQGLKIENLTIKGSSSSDLLFDTAKNLDCSLSSGSSVYYRTIPTNITNKRLSSGARLGKK